MRFIRLIECLFDRHRPIRREVAHGDNGFLSRCRHCGAEIKRTSHKRWVRR